MLSHNTSNTESVNPKDSTRPTPTPDFEASMNDGNAQCAWRGSQMSRTGSPPTMPLSEHYSFSQVGTTNQGQQQQQQQPQQLQQVAQQQHQARPGQEQHGQSIQSPNAQWIQSQKEDIMRKKHQLDLMFQSLEQVQRAEEELSAIKVERSKSDQGPFSPVGDPFGSPSTYPTADDMKRRPNRVRPNSSGSMEDSFNSKEQRGLRYAPGHFSTPPPQGNDNEDLKASLQQQWQNQMQRPATPPQQCSPGYSPITPAMTPHSHARQAFSRDGTPQDISQPTTGQDGLQSPIQFQGSDPNATIRARKRPESIDIGKLSINQFSAKSNTRHQENLLMSPPATGHTRRSRKFDVAKFPEVHQMEQISRFELGPQDTASFNNCFDQMSYAPFSLPMDEAPGMARTGSTADSFRSARSSVDLSVYSDLNSPTRNNMALEQGSTPEPENEEQSEERRKLEEQVQAYIHEDLNDPKKPFTCLFEDCGKQFGRRENIRSHIQTHLDIRHWTCPDCDKKFVRSHDLKRHRKKHTGERRHVCKCGKPFARQDALSRHRGRGICIGMYPGTTKTPAKRGRPPKNRPTMDDRLDKSARTRKRNAHKSDASSVSGQSESSWQESQPWNTDESMDDNMDVDQMDGTHDNPYGFSEDPYHLQSAFVHSPPMSPFGSAQQHSPKKTRTPNNAPTPPQQPIDDFGFSQMLNQQQGLVSMPEMEGESKRGSQASSQSNSPPELTHSSPQSSPKLVGQDGTGDFVNFGAHSWPESTEEQLQRLLGTGEDTGNSHWGEDTFFNLGGGKGNELGDPTFDDDALFNETI